MSKILYVTPQEQDAIYMANPASSASRAKIISYGAVLSAVYVVYAAVSSLAIGQVLQGVDVHFVRALLLMVGAASVKRFGVPTVVGFASALLLALSPISSPDFFLLIPATFAAGLFYDLALRGGEYARNALNLKRIFAATLLSSLSESIIVTDGLLAIGWPFAQSTEFLTAVVGIAPSLTLVVFFLLGRNILLSILGAETGGYVLSRLNRRPLPP